MHDLLNSLQEVLGDRYQLEAELGRGGMATVYRARDVKYDREVAIKVLPPDMSSLLGRERFVREIAIAASLQHPHIVPLFDSGGDGDVLYYVMPLIGGESLRDRLDRETQLPVDEALAITRDVAEGLGHAHARGVVHRDIKPENILLSAGRAMVADFGIARAIADIEAERLTSAGIIPGTPPYMSPEQAGGSYLIDGRADLYALGCVLYEMLAGSPPFTGKTAQVILARHIHEKPPSIQVARPTVSPGVQRVLEQLLAKVPADRYSTASRFVTALDTASAVKALGTERPGWRSWAGVASVAALLVMLVWVLVGRLPVGRTGGARPDTSRYVVLPFEREASLGAALGEEQLLHDALTRWTGIAVVDPFQVRDALARRGESAIDSRGARRLAEALGAGRYVRGEVSRIGDSLRVRAAVFDAASGDQLAEQAVQLAGSLAGANVAMASLADQLLFRGSGSGGRAENRTGTASAPARQAFASGYSAIERWDLAAADSGFNAAVGFDQDYAQASLWLAQVRWWAAAPVATWRSASERAASGRERLSSRDQVLSDALQALGRDDMPRACESLARLTRTNPYDFAAWYGLGSCLSRDDAVLPHASSPSRWKFRTSYHQAVGAYERAFELLPSMHQRLRGGSYEVVRRLLKTSGNAARRGRALPPDTATFAAYPSWNGDTLAFEPYRLPVPSSRWAAATSQQNVALRRQRERFHQVALAWVTAYPGSGDAMAALAISLQMLGDASALDTLRRARTLAVTPDERLRAASAEVWARVRFATPGDLAGLRAANALADSLLRASSVTETTSPLVLSGLASLLGRGDLAARLGRDPSVASEWEVPPALASSALPLLIYAALGGPLDSLARIESRLDSLIGSAIPVGQRETERLRFLARAAPLAMPAYRFRSLPQLLHRGDYLVDAEDAWLAGDSARVRQVFVDLREGRRLYPPAEVTMDNLYPEAWLLSALGDNRSAAAWLDPTLGAIASAPPDAIADPVRAASFVRAMALRADVAHQLGDSATAAQWAGAVCTLWSNPDAFLLQLVRRMCGLGR